MRTILIISDLHLGAKNSRTDQLEHFLDTQTFDQLVLNGDTIDDLNFKRFKPRHWAIVERLKKLAAEKRLMLIRGNHDEQGKKWAKPNEFDLLPRLIDQPFIDETRLEANDGFYLVLHGHAFDPTLHWPVLTDAADWTYRAVQRINKKSAKWLKHQCKHLGGVIEIVRQGAARKAKERGCVGVITGHTHYHEDSMVSGIRFINCGSWVDDPCHYVRVCGTVSLLEH